MTKRALVIVVVFVIVGVSLVVLGILPKSLKAPTTPPPQQMATTTAFAQQTATTSVSAQSTTTSKTSGASISNLLILQTPQPEDTVHSPLIIKGSARGNWYFEATAPVSLLDAAGATLASGSITAQGDWTVTDFVPFEGVLTFTRPATSTQGTLILKNDNPSGDSPQDKFLRIPVKF